METQKHVPPGSEQVTATTKAASRRAAYAASSCLRPRRTVSWIPTALRSQDRTPMRAYGESLAGWSSSSTVNAP